MDDNFLPMRSIGEVAENFDALRRPVKSSDRRPGPYPYYGAQGIVDYVDGYLFDGEFVLVAEDGENLRSRKEDIALIARGKFWVNNHAHILKGLQSSDTRFIYYAINSADISGYVTGSTIPKLSQGNLNRLPIPCPPLKEQVAIGELLGALDDKIDLNRRMNETLETMARAIFKDWFVDFGPVRAKAEGRPPYLAPNLWALFPDALDDADKPVGWNYHRLGEITDISIGRTPPRQRHDCFTLPPSGITWISIRDLGSVNIYVRQSSENLSTEAVREFRVPVVPKNTVIVSFKLTVGRVAITSDEITTNEAIAHLNRRGNIVTEKFLYSFMSAFNYETLSSTSSIATAVNSKSLRDIPVLLPKQFLIQSFEQKVTPFFDRIFSNIQENETLIQLRNLLLPKLMSGEIRLRDAEKAVEAVA